MRIKENFRKTTKKFFNKHWFILRPEIKDYLPKKNKFGMDEVISLVLKLKKISVFPVSNHD